MARILVTGAVGFVGRHLLQHLLSKGDSIFGFDKMALSSPPVSASGLHAYSGDICSKGMLERVLAEAQPDIVYHLAGILKSSDAEDFYRVNVLGTVALFEAMVSLGIHPRVLVTSSSAVYGQGFGGRPITERFKLRSVTHYAVSKVAQEMVAFRYHLVHGIPVICTRAFNLLGPGQPPTLACSAFARQIALAERAGNTDAIQTGDLSARRDFTDVRDVVRAYDLLVAGGKPGLVYNVSSQEAVSIRQCLDLLIEMAQVPLRAALDPGRLQANDVPIQVGCAQRLRSHTAWKPEITLRQSLADLLDCWRQEVRAEDLG